MTLGGVAGRSESMAILSFRRAGMRIQKPYTRAAGRRPARNCSQHAIGMKEIRPPCSQLSERPLRCDSLLISCLRQHVRGPSSDQTHCGCGVGRGPCGLRILAAYAGSDRAGGAVGWRRSGATGERTARSGQVHSRRRLWALDRLRQRDLIRTPCRPPRSPVGEGWRRGRDSNP